MAEIIYDTLDNLALSQLKKLSLQERRNTIVATPLTHPAYLSLLTYYYPAAITKPKDAEHTNELLSRGVSIEPFKRTITVNQAKALALLLEGRSTDEIAIELDVCYKAVQKLVANIFRAHDCDNRTELVARIYLSGTP